MTRFALDRLDAWNPNDPWTPLEAPGLGEVLLDYPTPLARPGWETETANEPGMLSAESLGLREEALGRFRLQLGRAARGALLQQFDAALGWAQRHFDPALGPYEPLARSALRTGWLHFLDAHPPASLEAEWRDERWRDAAVAEDRALIPYLRHWRGRLRRLQLAQPTHWSVPGMTEEEVIDALEVALLEAARTPGELDRYERPGREATLRLLGARKDRMRRKRRMYVVPPTFDLRHLSDFEPSALEMLEEHQRQAAVAAAAAGLPGRLNRPTREWLEHFAGDLAGHGEINPSRVADDRTKHRSSAIRAMETMQKELVSMGLLEAMDLPDPATRTARRPIKQPRR